MKKIIPFSWLPFSWGMTGKTREIARAEYELSGYELEKKLLELKKDDLDEKDYKRKLYKLDLDHNKISRKDYDYSLANLLDDDLQKQRMIVELDKKYGSISDLEYQKKLANINREPWVIVLNMDFSGRSSKEGSFELDWNEFFIEKLQNEGYVGATPDLIVNQWFMELCRNVAMEEFSDTGEFAADSEANLATLKRWNTQSEELKMGRRGYK